MLAQFFVIPFFHIFLACKKPTVDCYIVHQTRFFLSALKSTLAIPPGIAISQLGHNIFLNSTTSKTVITLQLTCPSGENLESWHAIKFGKHDPLCLAIKRNGWSVHFFAVEGAQGYCASTLRPFNMHLGLTRKLVRSSLETAMLL